MTAPVSTLTGIQRLLRNANRWRLRVLVLFLAVFVTARWLLAADWATPATFGLTVLWGAGALGWSRAIERVRTLAGAQRLATLIGVGDVFVLALLHWVAMGSWWMGATWFLIVVAVASMALRRRGLVVVTAAAIVAQAAVQFLDAAGLHASRKHAWTPSIEGDWRAATTNSVIGAIAIVLCAAIVTDFARRFALSRARYRALVDAAPEPILGLDASGRVRAVNAAARAFGFTSPVDAAPIPFTTRLLADDQAAVQAAIEAACGGTATTLEHRLVRHDGVARLVRSTFVPAAEAGAGRAVVLVADITEARARDAEEARLREELERAGRMRLVGQLVSGVAHELNNPLASILNYAELLRAETRASLDAEAIDTIHGQAMRARAIVRDLLQVVRAPGDRPRVRASLDEVVRRALPPLAARAAEAGTHVALEIVAEPRPQALDVPGIEQVVTNLVANAIDAAPGGHVTVRVEPMDGGTRLVVEDDGPGLPPEVLPRLFEPFFTTKATGHGTGLGLAVSRGIVERQGGTLVAENVAAGRGARFVVELPALADAGAVLPAPATPPVVPSPAPPASPVGAPAGDAGWVVVIDDEAAVRAPMVRGLVAAGWRVTEFGDAGVALGQLLDAHGGAVDAIVCDLRMPGMDGPTFWRTLDRLAPTLAARVIFATGDTASPEVRDFLAEAARPVLEKPYAMRDLLDEVEMVAEVTRARRQPR